jgi:hypothetical protein
MSHGGNCTLSAKGVAGRDWCESAESERLRIFPSRSKVGTVSR